MSEKEKTEGEQFEKLLKLESFRLLCPYWRECPRAQRILAGKLEPVVCGGVTDPDCVGVYLKHYTGDAADYP